MSLLTICRVRHGDRVSDRVCIDGRSLCVVDGGQQTDAAALHREIGQRRPGLSPSRGCSGSKSHTPSRPTQRGQPPPGVCTAVAAPVAIQFDAMLQGIENAVDAPGTRQDEVFAVVAPQLRTALRQHGVCNVVVHGGPGSGKSHTLLGNIYAPNEHGIVPRAVGMALNELAEEHAKGVNPEIDRVPVVAAASFLDLIGDQSVGLLREGDCAAVGAQVAAGVKPKLSPGRQRASRDGSILCQPTVAQVVICYMRGTERRRRGSSASCFQVTFMRKDGLALSTIRLFELSVGDSSCQSATASPKVSARLTTYGPGSRSNRGGATGASGRHLNVDMNELSGFEKMMLSRLKREPTSAMLATSQLAQLFQPFCEGHVGMISILCARLEDQHIPTLISALRLPWLLQQFCEQREELRSDRVSATAPVTERRALDVTASTRQNQLTQRQPLQQSLQRLFKRLEQPLQSRQHKDHHHAHHRQRQTEHNLDFETPTSAQQAAPQVSDSQRSPWPKPVAISTPSACNAGSSPSQLASARSQAPSPPQEALLDQTKLPEENMRDDSSVKDHQAPEEDMLQRELLQCIEEKQQTIKQLEEEVCRVRGTCETLRSEVDRLRSKRGNAQLDGPSQRETDLKLLLEKMSRDSVRQEDMLAAKIAERAELLDVYHGRKPVFTQPCHPPRPDPPVPPQDGAALRTKIEDSESDTSSDDASSGSPSIQRSRLQISSSTPNLPQVPAERTSEQENGVSGASRRAPSKRPAIPRLALGVVSHDLKATAAETSLSQVSSVKCGSEGGVATATPGTPEKLLVQEAFTDALLEAAIIVTEDVSSPSSCSSSASESAMRPRRSSSLPSPSRLAGKTLTRTVSRKNLKGGNSQARLGGPLWFTSSVEGSMDFRAESPARPVLELFPDRAAVCDESLSPATPGPLKAEATESIGVTSAALVPASWNEYTPPLVALSAPVAVPAAAPTTLAPMPASTHASRATSRVGPPDAVSTHSSRATSPACNADSGRVVGARALLDAASARRSPQRTTTSTDKAFASSVCGWAVSPPRLVSSCGSTAHASATPPGPFHGPSLSRRCHSVTTLVQKANVAMATPPVPLSLRVGASPIPHSSELGISGNSARASARVNVGMATPPVPLSLRVGASPIPHSSELGRSTSAASLTAPLGKGVGIHTAVGSAGISGHSARASVRVASQPCSAQQPQMHQPRGPQVSRSSLQPNISSAGAGGRSVGSFLGQGRGAQMAASPPRSSSSACLVPSDQRETSPFTRSPATAVAGVARFYHGGLQRKAASAANLHIPVSFAVAHGSPAAVHSSPSSPATTPTRERRAAPGGHQSAACAPGTGLGRGGYPRGARPPPRCSGVR